MPRYFLLSFAPDPVSPSAWEEYLVRLSNAPRLFLVEDWVEDPKSAALSAINLGLRSGGDESATWWSVVSDVGELMWKLYGLTPVSDFEIERAAVIPDKPYRGNFE